jgi:hypothetical protein
MILRFNSRTGPITYQLEFPPRIVEDDYGTSFVFRIANAGAPSGATLTLSEEEVAQIGDLRKVLRRRG